MKTAIRDWFNKRWPLDKFLHWSLHEEIPGGTRFSYALGSACLFLFVLQVLTGVWQMFYYVPTVDYAYASLNYLRLEIAFGWLIHGLHYWGAHAFTLVVGLHVLRVFVWGAYKKPRELVWLAGVVLLLLTAAYMFTGPVLPWDKKGYWAGKVGMNIAASAPLIGDLARAILQGSDKMGQLTLTRFFVIHVAILPFLTVVFIGIHLIAFRMFGSAGPWQEEKRKPKGLFWPEQLFKDALVAFLLFILLIALTVYFPPEISGLADPMDTRYVPKPEWNFLFLYQCLKYFSGRLEPVGTVGIPLFIILLFVSLPFIDRSPERNPAKRTFVLFCGFSFVAFVAGMTLIGYLSGPLPSEADQERLKSIAVIQQTTNKKSPIQNIGGVRRPGVRPPGRFDEPMSGEKLFKVLGCVQCHSVTGTASGNQGPDLLMVLDKEVSRQWLWAQLVAPEKHNPYSVMPTYGHLSDQNLNALIDYLQKLAAEKPKRFEETNRFFVKGDPGFGKELFKAEGCTQCHTLTGKRSEGFGPDLVTSLAKRNISEEWLRIQLVNPRRHNPNTVMPSYLKLGPRKINSLIAYLEQIGHEAPEEKKAEQAETGGDSKSKKVQAKSGVAQRENPKEMPEEEQKEIEQGPMQAIHIVGNARHGAVLYQQSCLTCHGPAGRIVAPDFPVPPQGVPAIHPIRRELFAKSSAVFARNIDPFLQHGMPNPSRGPDMPAFGDTHALTQAQIADIEAYVMQLNGIDRAEILNPGLEPKMFFYVVLGVTFLIGLFVVVSLALPIRWP